MYVVILAEEDIDLQRAIETLQEWCKKWQQVINTSKPKIMQFKKKGWPKTHYQFKLGEENL